MNQIQGFLAVHLLEIGDYAIFCVVLHEVVHHKKYFHLLCLSAVCLRIRKTLLAFQFEQTKEVIIGKARFLTRQLSQ